MNMKPTLEVIAGDRRWEITAGDGLAWMKQIPAESVDLVFADPPFNIGYHYDRYVDRQSRGAYLLWTSNWIRAAAKLLRPSGTMVVAINDENAAEVKVRMDGEGLTMRNWIIWHYTFGTHQRRKLGRCKTHLLYYVRDPKRFTFNADAIREESERQRIGDKRADPRGRVPSDVWKFSRLCGTFKERTGHPCQMPESIMERVVKAFSSPKDIVLDPFGGSFTTAAVAVRLRRRALSCDSSRTYCKQGRERVAKEMP